MKVMKANSKKLTESFLNIHSTLIGESELETRKR